MTLLQVRSCPDDVYESLSRLARAEHRSIAQQTVVLLRRALGMESARRERRRALLLELASIHVDIPAGFPEPEMLVREDRDR